MLPTFVAPFAL